MSSMSTMVHRVCVLCVYMFVCKIHEKIKPTILYSKIYLIRKISLIKITFCVRALFMRESLLYAYTKHGTAQHTHTLAHYYSYIVWPNMLMVCRFSGYFVHIFFLRWKKTTHRHHQPHHHHICSLE